MAMPGLSVTSTHLAFVGRKAMLQVKAFHLSSLPLSPPVRCASAPIRASQDAIRERHRARQAITGVAHRRVVLFPSASKVTFSISTEGVARLGAGGQRDALAPERTTRLSPPPR